MASQSEESSLAAPLSFTFAPSDEQLVDHYLRAYAAGHSLRWDHVVEADVYSADPRTLLGGDDGEIGYFLTKRTRHGNRVKRTAGGGTWTGQTGKNEIVSARGEVLGFKAMFSFCVGGGGGGDCSKKTTGYVMYEYELPSTADQGTRRQGELQEPVLCCIKKSAREIAMSHKRKREEAARSFAAAETDAAASVRRDVNNVNLVSDGLLGWTTAVDRQQPIPYHGKNAVTANAADFFDAGECSYNSAIPEYYADSVTSASDRTTMASSSKERETANGDINLACHGGALGMTADDDNLQPIFPYSRRCRWTEMMMDADIFYGLPGDVNAGNPQPPLLLPSELDGGTTTTTTAAAATADQQLLLAPDQDEWTAVDDDADDLDRLLSELEKEDCSRWLDSWLNDEPPSPPPPLVDSEMPFRNCQMPPPPASSSDCAASFAVIEGN